MDTWYVGTKNMNSEYHQYLLKYKEEKRYSLVKYY